MYLLVFQGKDIKTDDGGSATVRHFCEEVSKLEHPTDLHEIFVKVNDDLYEDLKKAKNMDKILPHTDSTSIDSIVMMQSS